MDKAALYAAWQGLSWWKKALVGLGPFLLLGIGWWYFVIDPQMAQIAQLQRQVETLDAEIAKYRLQSAKVPELERDVKRRQMEFLYAKTLLPEDAQALERLLASFEKLGRDEGIEFLLFQPGGETQADFYATRSVSIQVSGSFHRLMSYFDKLARLDRLVAIQSVQFAPVADFSPTEKRLNANVSLVVYRALTDAEIEARQKQQQGKKK